MDIKNIVRISARGLLCYAVGVRRHTDTLPMDGMFAGLPTDFRWILCRLAGSSIKRASITRTPSHRLAPATHAFPTRCGDCSSGA